LVSAGGNTVPRDDLFEQRLRALRGLVVARYGIRGDVRHIRHPRPTVGQQPAMPQDRRGERVATVQQFVELDHVATRDAVDE
jgi:hypothetical protein